MNNKPNMYRVNYLVMEGDHYAGGWGARSADVKTLGDVKRFSNVETVVPIFIEIGEPISDELIHKAVDERRQQEISQRILDDIAKAKEQLQRAEAAIKIS